MNEESELRVVFRTSQHTEVSSLAETLANAGIPSEVRIVVQASREDEAIALIEAHMQAIGAAPHEEQPAMREETDALLPCPNCETAGIVLRKDCSGCGYKILKAATPPVSVKAHATGARSFCPECRDPLTFPSGKCPVCAAELEPLENGDRLCPSLTHVLYRDTVGGIVCKACERVWVDVSG